MLILIYNDPLPGCNESDQVTKYEKTGDLSYYCLSGSTIVLGGMRYTKVNS
jgi:hypothetical protein